MKRPFGDFQLLTREKWGGRHLDMTVHRALTQRGDNRFVHLDRLSDNRTENADHPVRITHRTEPLLNDKTGKQVAGEQRLDPPGELPANLTPLTQQGKV